MVAMKDDGKDEDENSVVGRRRYPFIKLLESRSWMDSIIHSLWQLLLK